MATDDIKKIIAREEKWQRRWRDARAFVPKNDGSKPRFYNFRSCPVPDCMRVI